jgi:transcriptional regulator with XRE-family HTH domain
MSETVYRPIGLVLRDLLMERGIVTKMGNANFAAFAELLPSVHYETLRKLVTGERNPTVAGMAEMAEALKVDPHVFFEYALAEVQDQFDPRVVGEDQAVANLRLWTESVSRHAKRAK